MTERRGRWQARRPRRSGRGAPARMLRLLGELSLRGRVVLAAEVGVEHRGVGAHLLGGAGHQRRALAQHRHLVAEAHHELHVVLHHQERLAGPVELPDAIGEVGDQRRVDPPGGLVEQQHVGVGDQQRGELEQLALAVGQIARGLVRQPRRSRRTRAAPSRAAARRPSPRGASRSRSQPSSRWVATSMFSSTVSRAKILVSWNVRPMPSPNTRSGGALVISVPVEADLALLDPLVAGDHVEQRGLARAVRADQAVDRALARRSRWHPRAPARRRATSKRR